MSPATRLFFLRYTDRAYNTQEELQWIHQHWLLSVCKATAATLTSCFTACSTHSCAAGPGMQQERGGE
jgi:hypothetical protein